MKRACRGGASTKKPRGKLSVLTDPASPAGVTGCGRISSSDAPASKKYTPLDRNPTETNSSALRLTEWACWPAPGGLVSQLSLSVSAVWTCLAPADHCLSCNGHAASEYPSWRYGSSFTTSWNHRFAPWLWKVPAAGSMAEGGLQEAAGGDDQERPARQGKFPRW